MRTRICFDNQFFDLIIIIIIINEFHRDASLKQNFRAAEVAMCVFVHLC